MYEELKNSVKSRCYLKAGILSVFTVLILCFSFSVNSFILFLFALLAAYFSYQSIRSYKASYSKFLEIENFTGLSTYQFEKMLDSSQKYDKSTFINGTYFINFDRFIIFRLNDISAASLYETNNDSSEHNTSGTSNFYLKVDLTNGTFYHLYYSKETRDQIYLLLSKKANQIETNPVDQPKKINLKKHNAPVQTEENYLRPVNNGKINLSKHLTTSRPTAQPISVKQERVSVVPNPEYLGRPVQTCNELIWNKVNNSFFIRLTIALLGTIFTSVCMPKNFVLFLLSVLWFAVAAPLYDSYQKYRDNIFGSIHALHLSTKHQFDEMIKNSVRISEFGYVYNDYFFTLDSFEVVKLHDVINFADSAYCFNNERIFCITFFTSREPIKVQFKNEAEYNFVLDTLKNVLKINDF